MDLSNAISAVVPTLDGPVLRALAGTTTPLTGRQVHQLGGVGSEVGVRKVLARLVVSGLVHRSQAGASGLYVLNRDHLAANAVAELAQLRSALWERLREQVASWRPAAVHIAVYGSAARGNGNVESDIDLLVIRPDSVSADEESWEDQLAALRDRVYLWTGNHAHILETDPSRLRAAIATGEPIITEWAQDAITVFGPQTRTVLRGHGWHAPTTTALNTAPAPKQAPTLLTRKPSSR